MDKNKLISLVVLIFVTSLLLPPKTSLTHNVTALSLFPDGIITLFLSYLGYADTAPKRSKRPMEQKETDFSMVSDSCIGESGIFSSTDTTIPIPISASQGGTILSYAYVPIKGEILDLKLVGLDITHTCVGDLVIRLTHKGVSVLLLDQPGLPAIPFGCSEDHILADFDDEAPATAEDVCATTGGVAIAGRYLPMEVLSAFDGMDMSGEWLLTIEDRYPFADGGSLNDWNLEICYLPTALCEENLTITDTIPDGYYQASTLVNSLGVVTGSGSVIFSAGNCILLEHGFEVTKGSSFDGIIGECQ